MDLHLSFFMVVVTAVKLAASYPNLAEGSSDQLLFDDAALPSDQLLLPWEPASLDPTALLEDQEFSGFGGGIASLSTDTTSSLNDLSITSDLVALADCSISDNLIFPTIGKLRLKRLNQDQCEAPDNIESSPMLSVPTVDDLEENIRVAIMRENPRLYDLLWSSRSNEEDNTACMLLTANILPRGACTSGTTDDWLYRYTRIFAWNGIYRLSIWDLSYVTPGMIESNNTLCTSSG